MLLEYLARVGMTARVMAGVGTMAMLAACAGDQTSEQVPDTTSGIASTGSSLPALPQVSQAELETDRQLAPDLRAEARGDSVRLIVTASAGAQINALLPPVLELTGGNRYTLSGTAVTVDSAYFVGDVSVTLARDAFPVVGTLRTSYCRANERLCRNAERAVSVALPTP